MIILLTVTSLFFKTRLRVLHTSRISYVKEGELRDEAGFLFCALIPRLKSREPGGEE